MQILEDQKPVSQTPQHRDPHVHAGLGHMRRDPPLRLLALRLGPQHGEGPAIPLLWQERDKIHHQVARDPPVAQRVQAALQAAQGRCDQAQPHALLLDDGQLPEPWPKKHQLRSKTSVVTHNAWQVLGSLWHPRTTHTFTLHRSVTPRCQTARGINHRRIAALSFCLLLSLVLSLEASCLSVASIILPCMAAGCGSANNLPISQQVHKYLNQSPALDSSVRRRFHWHKDRSPLQQQTDSIHRNHCLISGKELNPCLFCNQIWCLERGAVPPFRPFFLSPSRC